MELVVEFFPIVEMFYLHTHYHSGTSICIQHYFADEQAKIPLENKAIIFFEEKTIFSYNDPKQLLTVNFICFLYLGETFSNPR